MSGISYSHRICKYTNAIGKMRVFIKWNEIREIGTVTVQTPLAKKERVCFGNGKLDEQEKSDH